MRQLRKLENLVGYRLQARDGEIGKLKQIYFDDQHWVVRYFVVHTGSWLLGRDVLILPALISAVDEENKSLVVELTREQVKNCPPVNTSLPVSKHYEREYHLYYDLDPYWITDPLHGPATGMPAAPISEEEHEVEHPHLRNSAEVVSYHLHAQDGELGHVEDFILEEPGWAIRYLEVDTRNWLPGKHVLISPTWIEQVDWTKAEVAVKLNREAIETAPPYDPAEVISRDYQVSLFAHYGMKYRGDL